MGGGKDAKHPDILIVEFSVLFLTVTVVVLNVPLGDSFTVAWITQRACLG